VVNTTETFVMYFNGGSFNATSFSNATVNLINYGRLSGRMNSAGNTATVGAVSGDATGTLSGGDYAGAMTYLIGGLNLDTTFAGTISNGSASTTRITKTGQGTWTLTGTANSYGGITTVSGGTLAVAALANGGVPGSTGTSSSAAANLVIDGGALQYVGNGGSTDRAFTTGTNGATLDASGLGAITLSNTNALTLAGSNVARVITLTGASTAANILAAAIVNSGTGATSLVKTGPGTWVLTSNASSYAGTTVSAGTLRVTGLLANSGSFNINGGLLDLSGTLNVNSVQIAPAGTLTGAGRINAPLTNNGTVAVTSGTLTINGAITNNGTMRFTGGAALSTSSTFTNNGVLDIMTSGGRLPPNFINKGLILDATSAAITEVHLSGSSIVLSAPTYSGHSYQLQTRDALLSGTWQNLGTSLPGNGTTQTFTDPNAGANAKRFYRLFIWP